MKTKNLNVTAKSTWLFRWRRWGLVLMSNIVDRKDQNEFGIDVPATLEIHGNKYALDESTFSWSYHHITFTYSKK